MIPLVRSYGFDITFMFPGAGSESIYLEKRRGYSEFLKFLEVDGMRLPYCL
jgi:hypothetical protein